MTERLNWTECKQILCSTFGSLSWLLVSQILLLDLRNWLKFKAKHEHSECTRLWGSRGTNLLPGTVSRICKLLVSSLASFWAWSVTQEIHISLSKSLYWKIKTAMDKIIFELVPHAERLKNPPAMWETWVQSLGWEDPLEKGISYPLNILAWRIPWIEESGRLHTVHGVTESDTAERLPLIPQSEAQRHLEPDSLGRGVPQSPLPHPFSSPLLFFQLYWAILDIHPYVNVKCTFCWLHPFIHCSGSPPQHQLIPPSLT